ncbi:hypothetical protein IQ215_08565 [Cyanobacterium stanieri LEGE 03274]|uniref:Uncharacterized protein n=1 Tax=Cyanobacterium stanieri LEGE 03274 TaxID=1828756 RepID=A0ABR9V4D0_9CHRO|nr:hypothetical protein [Cyanobacterium stanieri]MBE9222747.1 hypothetical protein [Cyanobacterium stanieri LEGE 03274]
MSCATSSSTQAQMDNPFFDQGLFKTSQEDFEGAMDDLRRASHWYFNNNDLENTYKASLLAEYLYYQQFRRDVYVRGEDIYTPFWNKFGRCLDSKCQYSLSWLNPSPLGSNFGGILVLEKFIRYLERSPGSAIPINQVTDVVVMPALEPDETLFDNCLGDRNNSNSPMDLIALVSLEKDITKAFHTNIRKLWRVDGDSQTIEELNVNDYPNAGCENYFP